MTTHDEKAALIKNASDKVKDTAHQSRTVLAGRVAELKALINQAIDAKLELAFCQINNQAEATIKQFENCGNSNFPDYLGLKVTLANLDASYQGAVALDSAQLTVKLTEVHLTVLGAPQHRAFTSYNPHFTSLQPGQFPQPPIFPLSQPVAYMCQGRADNSQ